MHMMKHSQGPVNNYIASFSETIKFENEFVTIGNYQLDRSKWLKNFVGSIQQRDSSFNITRATGTIETNWKSIRRFSFWTLVAEIIKFMPCSIVGEIVVREVTFYIFF